MSQFEREQRYRVLNLSDVKGALTTDELFDLNKLSQKVADYRQSLGKEPLQCVCPESDWPIYEDVWDMVQRLAEGRPQRVDQLKTTNAQLLAALKKTDAMLSKGIFNCTIKELRDEERTRKTAITNANQRGE